MLDGHFAINDLAARSMVGYVPQDVALYPDLTASENLAFLGRLYRLGGALLQERVAEALELTDLTDRRNDRVDSFSGGMKRRLNIAAGLLHHPQAAGPRRAHRRGRPPEPSRHLGTGPGIRPQRHGRPLHHALHGRGRTGVRQGRDHRPGSPHRRRYAARTRGPPRRAGPHRAVGLGRPRGTGDGVPSGNGGGRRRCGGRLRAPHRRTTAAASCPRSSRRPTVPGVAVNSVEVSRSRPRGGVPAPHWHRAAGVTMPATTPHRRQGPPTATARPLGHRHRAGRTPGHRRAHERRLQGSRHFSLHLGAGRR